MTTRTTETIDITPDMLKSKQGRVLVQEALERLQQTIGTVAHTLVQEIDDMEDGRSVASLERAAAFVRVREAITEWSKAGSDYAFTLGGINPETRKPYNFPADEVRPRLSDMDRLQIVGAALMPTAWPQMTAQEQATYIERWRPIYDAVRAIEGK